MSRKTMNILMGLCFLGAVAASVWAYMCTRPAPRDTVSAEDYARLIAGEPMPWHVCFGQGKCTGFIFKADAEVAVCNSGGVVIYSLSHGWIAANCSGLHIDDDGDGFCESVPCKASVDVSRKPEDLQGGDHDDWAPKSCDDGNACTTDDYTTEEGFCVGHTEVNCPADNNPCTVDICIPAYGCEYAPLTCDDQNPRTVDFCSPKNGKCVHIQNNDWAPDPSRFNNPPMPTNWLRDDDTE